MKRWRLCLGLLALWLSQATAHEMRPGYLEIKETAPATYRVLWKVPMRAGMRLQLDPRFPDMCREAVPRTAHSVGGAMGTRWTIRCDKALADQRIVVAGLENTFTDVLARVERLNGAIQTARIKSDGPALTVADSPSALALSATYLGLGVEHILLGVDHLLFVFALLLIVSGRRRWGGYTYHNSGSRLSSR